MPMKIRLALQQIAFSCVIAMTLIAGACSGNPPPEVEPTPPPTPIEQPPIPVPPPPPIEPPMAVQPEPILEEEPLLVQSLDESPLVPVFFTYDSSEIGPDDQSDLQRNATTLRQYSNWVITVEGHCDERGTAEYNLALGERRALAARNYLITLGISDDRLRTISYGKEFPFVPGQDEEAFQLNRRAHFVITAQ